MTEAAREFGIYSGAADEIAWPQPKSRPPELRASWTEGTSTTPPGAVVPWSEKKQDVPPISGDETTVRQVWQNIDGLANMYIWQVLLSF